MNPNAERFLPAYEAELLVAMRRDPEAYGITSLDASFEEAAARTARKMVEHMAAGTLVNVSAVMKRAARKLGIAPTSKAIHAYNKGDA